MSNGDIFVRSGGKWIPIGGATSGDINNAINSANKYTDKLLEGVKNDLNSIEGDITKLDEYIDGAFRNGVLSDVEKRKISSYLASLQSANTQVSARCEEIQNNGYLDESSNATLEVTKELYNQKYNNIISLIDSITKKDEVTQAEIDEVNNALNEFNNALNTFSSQLELGSQNIVSNIAKESENNSIEYTENYYINNDKLIDKTYVEQARADLETDTANVETTIKSSLDYINEAMIGGIIYDDELARIQTEIEHIRAAYITLNSRYTTIHDDPYLPNDSVEKANLERMKVLYDTDFNKIINLVLAISEDQLSSVDEIANFQSAREDYERSYLLLKATMEAAIEKIAIIKGNKDKADIKVVVDAETKEIANLVTDLVTKENNVRGFLSQLSQSGGIIADANIEKLQSLKLALQTSNNNLKDKANEISSDELLELSQEKMLLDKRIRSLNTSYTALEDEINKVIINKTLTSAQMTNINTLFTDYNTDVDNLKLAMEICVEKIATMKTEGIVPKDEYVADTKKEEAKHYADGLKSDLDKTIDNVQNSVDETADALQQFKDSTAIQEIAQIQLKSYLRALTESKEKIDNIYNYVTTNSPSSEIELADLVSAKGDYDDIYSQVNTEITILIESGNLLDVTTFQNIDDDLMAYKDKMNILATLLSDEASKVSDKVSTDYETDTNTQLVNLLTELDNSTSALKNKMIEESTKGTLNENDVLAIVGEETNTFVDENISLHSMNTNGDTYTLSRGVLTFSALSTNDDSFVRLTIENLEPNTPYMLTTSVSNINSVGGCAFEKTIVLHDDTNEDYNSLYENSGTLTAKFMSTADGAIFAEFHVKPYLADVTLLDSLGYKLLTYDDFELVASPLSSITSITDVTFSNIRLIKTVNESLLIDGNTPRISSEYLVGVYDVTEDLISGNQYTITLDVEPAEGVEYLIPFLSNGYKWLCEIRPSGRQVISKTFTAGYEDGRTPEDGKINTRIKIYRYPNDDTVTGETIIHWVKVEKGVAFTETEKTVNGLSIAVSDFKTAFNELSPSDTSIVDNIRICYNDVVSKVFTSGTKATHNQYIELITSIERLIDYATLGNSQYENDKLQGCKNRLDRVAFGLIDKISEIYETTCLVKDDDLAILQALVTDITNDTNELALFNDEVKNNKNLSSDAQTLLQVAYDGFSSTVNAYVFTYNDIIDTKNVPTTIGSAYENIDTLYSAEKADYIAEMGNSIAIIADTLTLSSADIYNELLVIKDEFNSSIDGTLSALMKYLDSSVTAKSELAKLETYLTTLKLSKTDIDARYNQTYNNSYLPDTEKIKLEDYKNFMDGNYNYLVDLINRSLDNGTLSDDEMKNIEYAIGDYSVSIQKMSEGLTKALQAIEEARLNGLVIGSRNLIIDSAFLKGVWNDAKGWDVRKETDEKNYVVASRHGYNTSLPVTMTSNKFNIQQADKKYYTISISIKVANFEAWDDHTLFAIEFYDSTDAIAQTKTLKLEDLGLQTLTNDAWYRVSYTCELGNPRTLTLKKSSRVVSGALKLILNKNGELAFKEPQVERSNIASEWNPAPEDSFSSLVSLAGRMTNVEQKTTDSSIINTVTESQEFLITLSGKVDNDTLDRYATTGMVEDINESLTNQMNSLDYVTPYDLESKLTQTSKNLTASFNGAGGVNLVRNSVGYSDIDYWRLSGIGEVEPSQSIEGVDTYGAGSCFILRNQVSISQTFNKWIGDFIVSAIIKKSSNGSGYIRITDENGVDNRLDIENKAYDYQLVSMVVSDSVTTNATIELHANADSEIIITSLMVHLGNTPLQWTTANGEVYNTNVMMNMGGIKVISNVYNGYTSMSPQEFAGFAEVMNEETGELEEEKVFCLNRDVTEVSVLQAKRSLIMNPCNINNTNNTLTKALSFYSTVESPSIYMSVGFTNKFSYNNVSVIHSYAGSYNWNTLTDKISITSNGTQSPSYVEFEASELEPSKKYTFSCKASSNIIDGESSPALRIVLTSGGNITYDEYVPTTIEEKTLTASITSTSEGKITIMLYSNSDASSESNIVTNTATFSNIKLV